MRPTSAGARRILSLALPRTRTSLAATLAADRLLLVATAALLLLACVPLFLTPILPFSDLGINTASAQLIWNTALGRLPEAHYYRVQWEPLPYWTTYAICAVLGHWFGPLVAAKLLTAMVFALVPLGTIRLLVALGRDPRLGLWSFALTWEHNLYAGWTSFLFGMGLVSFVLAWIIEAETVADGFRVAPYTALVALTHFHVTALLGIAVGAITFSTGPVRRRILVHVAALTGMAVVVFSWLGSRIKPNQVAGSAFAFDWHTPAAKLSQFFAFTLDNFSRPDAERAAALAFVLLIAGPLLLSLLPARGVRDRWSPVLLLASAAALYAALPFAISGPISHWYTYPRYATVILLWLLLIPTPRLRGWATWALLPGVLIAVLLDAKAIQQFALFGDHARPFLQVVAQVRSKATVLPFVQDDSDPDPDLRLPPYHQFYGYLSALKRGYSPYLWSNPSIPIIDRPVNGLPIPGWGGPFSMDTYGPLYDYALVQGFRHGDPVHDAVGSNGARPRLIIEVDRWRLYQLH